MAIGKSQFVCYNKNEKVEVMKVSDERIQVIEEKIDGYLKLCHLVFVEIIIKRRRNSYGD